MAVKLKVDASDLERVAKINDKASRAIDQSVTPHVNQFGNRMAKRLAREVSRSLTRSLRETLTHLPEFETVPFSGVSPSEVLEYLIPREGHGEHDSEYELETSPKFPYFYWVTQVDERVCEICGPRHGMIIHENAISGLFPAHESCRCRLDRINLDPLVGLFADSEAQQSSAEVADGVLQVFLREWL